MPVQIATGRPASTRLWRLLDVQFDIGTQLRGIEEARSGAQRVRVTTTVGDVLGEHAAGIDPAHVERAIRQHPERAATADIRNLKPDALFGANAHDCEIA